MHRVRRLAIMMGLIALIVVPSCSQRAPLRTLGLTDTEAQQLSLARFKTYRLGTVQIDATFVAGGTAVDLSGWVDYRTRTAYATAREDGTPRNLVIWNERTVAITHVDGSVTSPPIPQPRLDSSWGTAPIDTSRSELHQILVIIMKLGSDRPDNPLLVAQNGARQLRTEVVDGEKISVFVVPPDPSPTQPASDKGAAADHRVITYWIDPAGTIRRAAFTLTSGTDVTITIAGSGGPGLTDPFTTAPSPTAEGG